MLLQSPVELGDVNKAESITYHLVPIEGAKLQIPSAASQTVRLAKNGEYIVTVSAQQAPNGGAFPYKGSDPEAMKAMAPNSYLQSDSEEIIALARRAVGETKDAALAARQIESFVAGYITTKDLSIGYASAVEIARNREGDCTEHAVLTAAMCRAVGIPARLAVGVVYVGNFIGRKNVFGGHAWAEAYVGDKWLALDAAMVPAGFGPGHITLATGNGEPADFFALASTLGYFKIEKITIKEKPDKEADKSN